MAALVPSGGAGTRVPLSGDIIPDWEKKPPVPPGWLTTVHPSRPLSKPPLVMSKLGAVGGGRVGSSTEVISPAPSVVLSWLNSRFSDCGGGGGSGGSGGSSGGGGQQLPARRLMTSAVTFV